MNLDEGFISQSFVRSDRIYLNNASSSLIPVQSMKTMTDFMLQYNKLGPDSRDFSSLLAEKTNNLRSSVSKLLRCRPEEVILTQSTTDGINLVAGGLTLENDSNIVIRGTTHEHHANYLPWLRLGKKAQIRSVDHDNSGFFKLSELEALLDRNTRLVALSHALYNTGAVLPIREIGKTLHDMGVPFFVDAAQTIGCIGDFDFESAKYSFMAFNGFKWLCGPMGIGIFVCKKETSDLLEPLQIAGESAMLYDSDKIAYKELPDKFQASYRNYVAIAGLDSSITLLTRLGLQNIREKIIGLANMLRQELAKIPGVVLYGPDEAERRTSIVSFTMDGHAADDIVQTLEKHKIVVALREISNLKVIRISPHFFNTESEIQRTVEAIRQL